MLFNNVKTYYIICVLTLGLTSLYYLIQPQTFSQWLFYTVVILTKKIQLSTTVASRVQCSCRQESTPAAVHVVLIKVIKKKNESKPLIVKKDDNIICITKEKIEEISQHFQKCFQCEHPKPIPDVKPLNF